MEPFSILFSLEYNDCVEQRMGKATAKITMLNK